MAITTQLDTIMNQLSNLVKENHEPRTDLHDLSSKVANESVTHDDICPLISAVRDSIRKMLEHGPRWS